MKNKYKVFNLLLALVFLLSLLGVEGNTTVLAKSSTTRVDAYAMLQQACFDGGRGFAAGADALTGFTQFVGTKSGQPIRVDAALKNGSSEDVASGFLSSCGGIFGLDTSTNEFHTMKVSVSNDGKRTSVRFQQVYQNIPVVAGEMIVQLDDNQDILSVSGETLPRIYLDTTPKIDASSAKERALTSVSKKYDIDSSLLSATEPELWIYSPALLEGWDGPAQLVWRMEVGTDGVREFILIGAERGNTVVSFNQIEFGKSRILYDYSVGGVTLSNGTIFTPGQQICTEETGLGEDDQCDEIATGGDDEDFSEAFVYSGVFYDYFFNKYGRDSFDGSGADLLIVAKNDETADCNAHWDGTYMVVDTGCAHNATDDTIGHEFTHGIIENSANLYYYYQAGSINESIADIFGEFIDWEANSTNYPATQNFNDDTAGVKWQLFEDLGGATSRELRDMKDPTAFGDPDKMSSGNYYAGTLDNGGVHTNSGVNNKAAYLMTDGSASEPGGVFNTYTITGIGRAKVSALYYEVLTQMLVSGSDYQDLYDALIQTCNNFVSVGKNPEGLGAFNASDCTEVTKALNAVEMNAEPTVGFNPDAPVCDGGTPYSLYRSHTDEGQREWTSTWDYATYKNITGSDYNYNHWYYINGLYASSGVHSLWADDFYDFGDGRSDSSMTLRSKVVLPTSMPNAFLRFEHSYGFEDGGYDGGVVEISFDNGKTWSDLQAYPGVITDNGYNGVINASKGNPLGARSAFIDDSHGYVSTRYNISVLRGKALKFRLRMGTDQNGSDTGWYVDNIGIYSCHSTPISATTVTFKSQAKYDGFVLESGEKTNRGGARNAKGFAFVGDDKLNKQYKGVFSFNTASLPDTAIILSAYLNINRYGGKGTNPFTTHGNLVVDIKSPRLGQFVSLELIDFQAKAIKGVAVVDPNLYPDNWHKSVLSAAVNNINKKKTTQIRIRFTKDDNNDKGADYLRFYANGGAKTAQLVITYYVP